MRGGGPVGHREEYTARTIPEGRTGYNGSIPPSVITFDAGQTLVELDLDFLAQRLAERGAHVTAGALVAAAPAAWARYDALVEAGAGHPWQELMSTLLAGAGVREAGALADWLWSEQPKVNLFRKPIPGMIDLARELGARGAKIAVLSNSEGRLAELLEQVGIAHLFGAIIDSGRLGIEKPDPRIFHATLDALGVRAAEVDPIHIGDVWSADIAGARNVGWRALWYGRKVHPVDDPKVAIARDPTEARAALVRLGAL